MCLRDYQDGPPFLRLTKNEPTIASFPWLRRISAHPHLTGPCANAQASNCLWLLPRPGKGHLQRRSWQSTHIKRTHQRGRLPVSWAPSAGFKRGPKRLDASLSAAACVGKDIYRHPSTWAELLLLDWSPLRFARSRTHGEWRNHEMEKKYHKRAALYHTGQLTISNQIGAISNELTALIFRPQPNIYLMTVNFPSYKALSAYAP